MATTTTAYRPGALADRSRAGFSQLLLAEWTKLRSVRRWVAGILAAVVLTVLISLLAAAGSGTDANQSGEFTAGPDGQPVLDDFRFVHRQLSGDGSITARVRDQRARHEWAAAGVMIKEAARSGAPYAAMVVTAEHGIRLRSNFTTDRGVGTGTAPRWLRLTRLGASVTGYESTDGVAWHEVGTVDLRGLPQTAEVGLFVMSPRAVRLERQAGSTSVAFMSTESTATFDNVRVAASARRPPPLPWITEDVGNVGNGKVYPGGRGGKDGGGGTAEPRGTSEPQGTAEGRGTADGRGTAEAGGTGGGGDTAENVRTAEPGAVTDVTGALTVTGSGEIAPNPPDDDIVSISLIGVFVGLMVVGAVGVLFTTSEYKRGMIRTTFAASPRRGRVLAAKAIVIGAATFAAGLVASFAAFLLAQPILRGNGFAPPAFPPPSLSDPSVLRAVVGAAAFLAVVAVFGLGVGTILRRSAVAITIVIVILIVPTIAGGFLPLTASRILMLATPASGFAILRAKAPTSTLVEPWASINPWVGFAIPCAYAALTLALAAWLLRRRDA
jgi:ABC-type transport system involved in multi-copper enzyme maturation permease subunit